MRGAKAANSATRRSLTTIQLNKSSSDEKSIPVQKKVPDKVSVTKIELNSRNALNVVIGPNYHNSDEFNLMQRKDYWHKFIILNANGRDKEHLLLVIMSVVYPLDLIPVMYKDDGPNITFLARSCASAIEKLCRMNLTLDDRMGSQLSLSIILGYTSTKYVNMQNIWVKVIKKRYNVKTRHLNLSNFHKDPELAGIIFCPLSYSKILHHVLRIVASQQPVRSIDLSNNGIFYIRILATFKSFRPLFKLDVRQNALRTLNELGYLKPMNIRELLLDQNPLCESYESENAYIHDLQSAIPSLVKLDGASLPVLGLPRTKRNYLPSQDDIPLANQFVEHYFTLYDGDDRMKLIGLYHGGALFSLTSTFLPAQNTSNTARLTEYTMESRNILKLSDYSKSLKLLHHGPEEIVATLCKLPRSEHDQYSFTVDMVNCSNYNVISVSGVFREPAVLKAPLVRSFYRVFVLKQIRPNVFQIINETLHIKNATSKELERSFLVSKSPSKLALLKSENLSEADKDEMSGIMSQITTMNKKWSRRCLDETKWDLKEALTVFTELYKMCKVPEDAF